MPERIPLLLFSGGADSTLLLKWQLTDSNCDVLYIDGNQCPRKMAAETVARERIIDELLTSTEHRVRTQYDLREKMRLPHSEVTAWQQLMPWLVGAALTIDPQRHSQLQIGYIMGDDMAGNLDRVTKAWDALVQAVVGERWDSQQGRFVEADIPVVFRLRYMRKSRIYDELGEKLLDLTWTCELPAEGRSGPVPCNRCSGCETRFNAMRKFKGAVKAEKQRAAWIEDAKLYQEEQQNLKVAINNAHSHRPSTTRKKTTKKSASKTRKTTKKK